MTRRTQKSRKPSKLTDLVRTYADREGVSPAQARRQLHNLTEALADELRETGNVATPFGRMVRKDLPAQRGGKSVFMPMLGRTIKTKPKKARRKVRLFASKRFRELLG
jgi:hypothetical protein